MFRRSYFIVLRLRAENVRSEVAEVSFGEPPRPCSAAYEVGHPK